MEFIRSGTHTDWDIEGVRPIGSGTYQVGNIKTQRVGHTRNQTYENWDILHRSGTYVGHTRSETHGVGLTEWSTHEVGHIRSGIHMEQTTEWDTHGVRYRSGIPTKLDTHGVRHGVGYRSETLTLWDTE